MTEALAVLRGVTRRFEGVGGAAGPLVLDGIDLEIERGAALAVVGPSGSGKSTLLNIIGGLDRPTTGSVLFDGEDLARKTPDELARVRNERLGFVFQAHHLLPQCTALENVLVPTLVAPDKAGAPERAKALLERVGLGPRLGHRPAELSGGECQRVAVVRALINEPELLLADEPTGSLDAEAASELMDLFLELNAEKGVALVFVTHATQLAARIGPVLRLAAGRIAQSTAPA